MDSDLLIKDLLEISDRLRTLALRVGPPPEPIPTTPAANERVILKALATGPMTASQLAAHTGVPRASVYWNLNRLVGKGRVTWHRPYGGVRDRPGLATLVEA